MDLVFFFVFTEAVALGLLFMKEGKNCFSAGQNSGPTTGAPKATGKTPRKRR
jgi:hypothetical protein